MSCINGVANFSNVAQMEQNSSNFTHVTSKSASTNSFPLPNRPASEIMEGCLSINGIVKRQLNTYPNDPFIATGTYTANDYLQYQKKILMDLTQRTQFEAAGRIQTSTEPKEGLPSIIDEDTWDDLALVTGSQNNQKACVAGQLDKTYTLGGRIFLYGRLARPIDDLELIKKRQHLIKELTEPKNQSLLDSLTRSYEKLQTNEKHMVSPWNPKQMLPGRADKYFSKYFDTFDKMVNESSFFLTIYASLETAKIIVQSVIVTISAIAMPLFALSLTGVLGKMSEGLRAYYIRFAGASGPLYLVLSLFKSSVLMGAAAVVGGVVAIATCKTSWLWSKAEIDFDAMIHSKMLSIARFYRTMKDVRQLMLKNPSISKNLEHFHKLETFFNNKDLFKIFGAFDSRTFDGEAGYFFQRGNVLFPWRQLEQPYVRKEFENALTAIAEIDAVLSTAKVFKESKVTSEGEHFCFPEFVESEYPVLELENYWHPMVKKPVLNSIKLGQHAHNPNIIVTGPNMGGKSTSLRSITSCVITGQSLGIAPAGRMITTLFSRVKSCMHTTDNIGAGDSLFQSQVKYADRLANDLEALPKNKFSLCALDEVFTGTKATDGAAFAYGAAKVLGAAKNSITMFATHFTNIPKLAEDPEARYTNFKVSVDKSRGMKPLHKLVPGVSDQHVAIEVAKKLKLNAKMLKAIEAEKDRLEKEGLGG